MPLYSYRATNDDGKEVRGTIEAPDTDAARKALEDIHLEVLEINEASRAGKVQIAPEEPRVQPLSSFAFEGQDATGKVHRGTIQAESKYGAFKKLRDDQSLLLSMLAPMGALPKYNDPELLQWQRGVRVESGVPKPAPEKEAAPPPPPLPQVQKTVSFAGIPTAAPKPAAPIKTPQSPSVVDDGQYHPLVSTIRLYCGWLLAWYALFVAIGYYATVRALPWQIPFVQAFFVSPLIFSFVTAIFLFLLFSAINRRIHGRLIGGAVFTLVGIGIFWVVRTSM